MRLDAIDLTGDDGATLPDAVKPLFEKLRRVFREVRNAFTIVEGSAVVVRYNVPPTAPPTVAALPTAGQQWVGRLVLLDKNGAADDELYCGYKQLGGTFGWKKIF